MKMPAFRKMNSESDADDNLASETHMLRSQRWSERMASYGPLATRRNIDDLNSVSKRPANDDNLRANSKNRLSPHFLGSRYFWAAAGGTLVFCLVFAVMMGFSTSAAILSLFHNPVQYSPFLLSTLVIAAIQWLLAMSAHRQAVNHEMWRRMMSVTQKLNDPGPILDEANRTLTATFDRLASDLDARMTGLDERTAEMSLKIGEIMQRAETSAEINISQMKSIAETADSQRESLQRISATISTEVLPIINKLEGTVISLEATSQGASGVLGALGAQLQQSTRDLQACLDEFNRANHTVAPEIEKRVARFEATINRLPDQIEAALTRLGPMSDTIADAAMLSTANVDVMEQIAKQITGILQNNRRLFSEFSDTNTELFRQTIDTHVERFRELLTNVIAQESTRVSSLARELSTVADTATVLVNRLQQPVTQVSGAADKALAEMNAVLSSMDHKIQASIAARITELNQSASQAVNIVGEEIEAAASALQTLLETGSSDLLQRVGADVCRFEDLIGEAAKQTSERVAAVISELPSEISRRMDTEIARVEGSLKGTVSDLSDQMQGMVDAIPNRLATMTRETVQSLETDMERTFDVVAQRSETLNQQFRKSATETSESVLGNYVDFIFLALERFRSEMEGLDSTSRNGREAGADPATEARAPETSGNANQPGMSGVQGAAAPRIERRTSTSAAVPA